MLRKENYSILWIFLLDKSLLFVNAFYLHMDFADLVLLKCLVCFKQFWCLNITSVKCSDLTGHAQDCQAAWGICRWVKCSGNSSTGSTKALGTLCACWAGVSVEETQLGLEQKVKNS